jgi:hypothetical protein
MNGKAAGKAIVRRGKGRGTSLSEQADLKPSNDLNTENQKFHFFPNLPIELRRMIWNHALPTRQIEIHCTGRCSDLYLSKKSDIGLFHLRLTCQEALAVTTMRYQQIWASTFGLMHVKKGLVIFFDHKNDYILLSGATAVTDFFNRSNSEFLSEQERFKTIALRGMGFQLHFRCDGNELISKILPKLKSLEKIIIFVPGWKKGVIKISGNSKNLSNRASPFVPSPRKLMRTWREKISTCTNEEDKKALSKIEIEFWLID